MTRALVVALVVACVSLAAQPSAQMNWLPYSPGNQSSPLYWFVNDPQFPAVAQIRDADPSEPMLFGLMFGSIGPPIRFVEWRYVGMDNSGMSFDVVQGTITQAGQQGYQAGFSSARTDDQGMRILVGITGLQAVGPAGRRTESRSLVRFPNPPQTVTANIGAMDIRISVIADGSSIFATRDVR